MPKRLATSLSLVVRLCRPAVLLGLSLLLAGALPTGAMPPDDPGFVQFKGASFPVDEEAGTVTVVVKRQRGDSGAVSVDYATTAGSAEAGADYEETDGTLEWADGDRSDKSFTVTIFDDDVDEGQETFGVGLSNPSEGLGLGAVTNAVVRIKPSDRDDDDDDDGGDDGGGDGEPGVIKLTAVSFPAFESSGEATFVVERIDGSDGEVMVDFSTVDGSALSGEDYVTTSGTLTWADGEEGEQTVVVPLIDDTEAEELETISVILTNATGGASLGERDVASIVVIDDDGSDGSCVPDEETLCLRQGRFQITGSWEDFDGNTGPFNAVPASDETGLIYFFDPSNFEILVKVLDGCPINGHYWVFYAATTNLGFTMEVTDLSTGDTSTYVNPVGVLPLAVTDITAFPTCP